MQLSSHNFPIEIRDALVNLGRIFAVLPCCDRDECSGSSPVCDAIMVLLLGNMMGLLVVGWILCKHVQSCSLK